MRNHHVLVVDNDALPDGVDWALAQSGDSHALFLKAGADLPQALSEAWVAFHNTLVEEALRPVPPDGLSARRPGGLRVWSALAVAVAASAAVAALAVGGLAGAAGFPTWTAPAAVVTTLR